MTVPERPDISYVPEVEHSVINVSDAERLKEYRTRTTYGALDLYLKESQEQDPDASSLRLAPTDRPAPRTVVAIPVAGHQEAANIDRTLAQYAKQNLDKRFWEIVMYVNMPPNEPDKLPLSSSDTMREIKEAKERYGLDNLRLAEHQYDKTAPIGRVRRDLWDLVIKDLHAREVEHPVLVINNDADLVSIPSDYVAEYTHSHALGGHKIISGPIRFGESSDAPTAGMLVNYYWHLYSAYLRKQQCTPLVEANSAYDIATYCALGGIDPEKEIGEVLGVIDTLHTLNNAVLPPVRAHMKFNKRLFVNSSSRRQLAALALGHGVEDTWDTSRVAFTAHDSLRAGLPDEAAERMAQENFTQHIDNIDNLFVYNPNVSSDVRDKMKRYAWAAKRILGVYQKQAALIGERELIDA